MPLAPKPSGPTAIKISGRKGKNEFINDTYEPMQVAHNDRPCWVARDVAPRYLFNTGKTRWVISNQLDDGARCWAFLGAPKGSTDPLSCPGPWTCAQEDGSWQADPAVKCSPAAPNADKFMQLRLSLDADMKQYGLIELESLKALWRKLDYNGNNVVSLAEIDKLVVEMVAAGTWPEWLNNKPALMRAYKAAVYSKESGAEQGSGNDEYVHKSQFHALLLNLFWYNKLFQIFEEVDTGHDRRIDCSEFQTGMAALGLKMSQDEAKKEFDSIDGNHGGQVLFVEFCAWVRKRVNPDANPNFDPDIVAGEDCNQYMRKSRGDLVTHEHFISKKCFADFDALEAQIKDIVADNTKLLALWTRLDFDGNHIVSLAEIDKLVVEAYPLLNHKPALMRAYKKTITTDSQDKDDWVHKKEFKALLANLFYFNKIFWIFSVVDTEGKDRRLSFDEFKQCMILCNCPLDPATANQQFKKIAKNGNHVLFDQFCAFVTSSQCPQAFTNVLA